MTRDEIVRMADEVHGPLHGRWWDMDIAALERFAALVAAQERKALIDTLTNEQRSVKIVTFIWGT
jgi:hypothetical protein